MARTGQVRERLPTPHHNQPRLSVLTNDNYCITQGGVEKRTERRETIVPYARLLSRASALSVQSVQTLNTNCHAVTHVTGQLKG